MLEKGQVDITLGIRKSHQRSQYLSFLEQPYKTQEFPLNFFQRTKSTKKINQYDDLKSLRIGVLRGALYFSRFDQDNQLTKVQATNHKQLLELLLKKRIDTFPEREESITPWISQKEYKEKIKLAKFKRDKEVGSYMAIAKKSPFISELTSVNQFQQTLIQTGVITQLLIDAKIGN